MIESDLSENLITSINEFESYIDNMMVLVNQGLAEMLKVK